MDSVFWYCLQFNRPVLTMCVFCSRIFRKLNWFHIVAYYFCIQFQKNFNVENITYTKLLYFNIIWTLKVETLPSLPPRQNPEMKIRLIHDFLFSTTYILYYYILSCWLIDNSEMSYQFENVRTQADNKEIKEEFFLSLLLFILKNFKINTFIWMRHS